MRLLSLVKSQSVPFQLRASFCELLRAAYIEPQLVNDTDSLSSGGGHGAVVSWPALRREVCSQANAASGR